MEWDFEGLAKIACKAAGERWSDLTNEEKAKYRRIASALLEAIARGALA